MYGKGQEKFHLWQNLSTLMEQVRVSPEHGMVLLSLMYKLRQKLWILAHAQTLRQVQRYARHLQNEVKLYFEPYIIHILIKGTLLFKRLFKNL